VEGNGIKNEANDENNSIINNTIASSGNYGIYNNSDASILGYNLIAGYVNGACISADGECAEDNNNRSTTSIAGENFADYTGGDFSLTESSPAINDSDGTGTYSATDFDGTTRPVGTYPEPGAFESLVGFNVVITGTSLINEKCGDDDSPYEDPQNVAFALTSTVNANCNYEVKATASPCDGESYTTLTDAGGYGGGAMTTGQNTKIHSENAVMSCATTRYAAVICSAVEGDSNCLEITLSVAAGGDVDPQPNVGDGINIKTGGTVSIITGGTVSIE